MIQAHQSSCSQNRVLSFCTVTSKDVSGDGPVLFHFDFFYFQRPQALKVALQPTVLYHCNQCTSLPEALGRPNHALLAKLLAFRSSELKNPLVTPPFQQEVRDEFHSGYIKDEKKQQIMDKIADLTGEQCNQYIPSVAEMSRCVLLLILQKVGFYQKFACALVLGGFMTRVNCLAVPTSSLYFLLIVSMNCLVQSIRKPLRCIKRDFSSPLFLMLLLSFWKMKEVGLYLIRPLQLNVLKVSRSYIWRKTEKV